MWIHIEVIRGHPRIFSSVSYQLQLECLFLLPCTLYKYVVHCTNHTNHFSTDFNWFCFSSAQTWIPSAESRRIGIGVGRTKFRFRFQVSYAQFNNHWSSRQNRGLWHLTFYAHTNGRRFWILYFEFSVFLGHSLRNTNCWAFWISIMCGSACRWYCDATIESYYIAKVPIMWFTIDWLQIK